MANPNVRMVHPQGGQRGTEVNLTFVGDNLVEPQGVMWYEPGVEVLSVKAIDKRKVVVRVKIAKDAQLGEHCLLYTSDAADD